MTEEVTAGTGGGGDTSDRARSVLPVLTDTDRPRGWEPSTGQPRLSPLLLRAQLFRID